VRRAAAAAAAGASDATSKQKGNGDAGVIVPVKVKITNLSLLIWPEEKEEVLPGSITRSMSCSLVLEELKLHKNEAL
jgi:hypothetical protein